MKAKSVQEQGVFPEAVIQKEFPVDDYEKSSLDILDFLLGDKIAKISL